MRDAPESKERIPWWVFAIIFGLAAVEPVTHLWLRYGLGGGIVHTGFHIGDTPFFLTSMQIFENGFHSPYVICGTGTHDVSFFALPHHWVYGALGYVGGVVGSPHFLTLGFANALFGGLYLWLAYRFMRCVAVGKIADRAFLLFTLGGGLGGVLYILSGLVGGQASPNFETWLHRYARYELIEGPFLSPLLVMPRLYYTLPLALGFASLIGMLRAARAEARRPGVLSLLAILGATYLNVRVGALFFLVALSFIVSGTRMGRAAKVRYVLCYGVPVFVAGGLVFLQLHANPSAVENVNLLLRRSAWFGAVLSAVFWYILPVGVGVRQGLSGVGALGRVACGGALGFLGAFVVLYFAHQVYWGNLWSGGDTAAAVKISDWALVGALAGGVVAYWGDRRGDLSGAGEETAWLVVWLLPLLALSIAAFGGGWFLRLMPERILIVLGVPMALLASVGFEKFRCCCPRFGRGLLGVIVVSGVVSHGVSALCFQGPVGRDAAEGAFDWAHSEIMLEDDGALLARLPSGRYLAPASIPPIFGDVIVHGVGGAQTVFGQPTLEFSGVDMFSAARAVQTFFSVEADEALRKEYARRWCVNYIYCPATRPVDGAVVAALRDTPWLEEVDGEGAAVLFRVGNLEGND